MDHPQFNVSRFENKTESVSWRVTGYLHGIRVRKNFPTREEAAAEKAALEVKAIQAASGQRAAVTSLSDVQLREAESLFHRVAGKAEQFFAIAPNRAAVAGVDAPSATHRHRSAALLPVFCFTWHRLCRDLGQKQLPYSVPGRRDR